jgi:hypothetical protein
MKVPILLGGMIWIFVSEASADCVGSSRNPGQTVGYDKIFVDTSSLPSSIRGFALTAANLWNDDDCNTPIAGAQYTFEFPILSIDYSQGAGRTITMVYAPGFNPANDRVCGTFAGNTITLFERSRVDGVPKSCLDGPLVLDTMTHEFGHLLGLVDQYGSSCSTHIMSQGGFTSTGAYIERTLHTSECQKVAETTLTPAEQYYVECQNNPALCPPDNQCGYIPEYSWCSPIVLDLHGNGFHFSGPDLPVWFDIDADAVEESICWTTGRSDDAFLAWDRNRNGVINDGSELFGDSTPFLNGLTARGIMPGADF